MTPPFGFVRTVTADERTRFWADGAIVLRAVLDPEFVAAITPAVMAILDQPEMADMTAMGDGLAASGEAVLRESSALPATRLGRFRSGVDHWREHEEFRRFACDSALPVIVAELLDTSVVHLWEDSVLVKEPGAGERTAWHQDLSYFNVVGDKVCTTWTPLDRVDAASGAMAFARGSHRWDELFRPNLFVSTMPIPGTEGREVPDIDSLASSGAVELLQWDLEPGDVSVHHARTLHAAGANRSADRWRRAISIRYCGDDARFLRRPGAPAKPHHAHAVDGDGLDRVGCPQVWSREQSE